MPQEQPLRAPRLSFMAMSQSQAIDAATRLYDKAVLEGWTRSAFKGMLDAIRCGLRRTAASAASSAFTPGLKIDVEVDDPAKGRLLIRRDLAQRVHEAEGAPGLETHQLVCSNCDVGTTPRHFCGCLHCSHHAQIWVILRIRPSTDPQYPLNFRPPPATPSDPKSRHWSPEERLRLIWHVKDDIVPGCWGLNQSSRAGYGPASPYGVLVLIMVSEVDRSCRLARGLPRHWRDRHHSHIRCRPPRRLPVLGPQCILPTALCISLHRSQSSANTSSSDCRSAMAGFRCSRSAGTLSFPSCRKRRFGTVFLQLCQARWAWRNDTPHLVRNASTQCRTSRCSRGRSDSHRRARTSRACHVYAPEG